MSGSRIAAWALAALGRATGTSSSAADDAAAPGVVLMTYDGAFREAIRPPTRWLRRAVVAALALVGLAAAAPAGDAAEPASVVFVTRDCAGLDFICPAFRRAAQ